MRKSIIPLLAAALLSGPVLAETYAITNGVIHTMGAQGVLKKGTVIIEDGRITAVGENVVVDPTEQPLDHRLQLVQRPLALWR